MTGDTNPSVSSTQSTDPTIALIGGGPRGISVLERISAALRDSKNAATGGDSPRLTVHIVDDVQPGAGRVWRTDQSATLCMNTLADAVTLFTEPESTVGAPVVEGPTMYEWIQLIRGEELDAAADPNGAKAQLFAENPTSGLLDGDYSQEIRDTLPESHPSRALYGEYLRWVFDLAVDRAKTVADVQTHQVRATDIAESVDQPGRDVITLDNGTTITADATVLAIGWVDTEPDALETFMASSLSINPTLTWIRPGNPADQPIDGIPSFKESGEEVLVRGLGMGFFDAMAMLTIDRGGKFVADETTRSGLVYQPSGKEPHLVVSSFHGYPYLPKPVYGSLPPAAWMPRFRAAVDELSGQDFEAGTLDFGAELWPAILRDAQEAYYRVLLDGQPDKLAAVQELIDDPEVDPWSLNLDSRLDGVVEESERFDLEYHADPVARIAAEPVSIDELTGAIGDHLAADLAEADAGRASAVKAGLQVIGSARKPSAVVDEPNKFTTESRRGSYADLRRMGQKAGSGPPAFRTAELLCLVDAGYVRFIGGHPTVVIDPEGPAFIMTSDTTGDEPVESHTLLDAWLHKPDSAKSADPMSQALRFAGRMRSWERADGKPAKAPEVDRATTRLVGELGEPDPRVHMIGIPMQDVRADMTISPMPRTNPLMLQETDQAARSALQVALGE